MRRPVRLLLAAAVLAALGAGPARAADDVVAVDASGRSITGAGGPAFAGGAIVWTRGGKDGAVVVERGDGRSATVIATIPALGETPASTDIRVAASTTHVAVVAQADEGCTADPLCRTVIGLGDEVWAGPLSGPLRRVAGCRRDECTLPDNGQSSFVISLAGDRLLVRQDVGGSEVVDLTTGSRTPAGATPDGRPAIRALAGPFQLRTGAGRALVEDAASGTPRFEVPVGALKEYASGASAVALQDDGTITFPRAGARGTGGWASLAEPTVHPLARFPTASGVAVRPYVLAGRQIAASDRLRDRFTALEINDFLGTRRTRYTRLFGDIAFDGRRVAWNEQPCALRLVVVWELGAGAGPQLPRSCPPPVVATGTVRLHQTGTVPLTLRCPAVALAGCGGVVASTLRGLRGGHRISVGASGHFTIEPGRSVTLRLRPTARGRRALSRMRRTRAEILLLVPQPGDAGPFGERHVVRRAVRPAPRR